MKKNEEWLLSCEIFYSAMKVPSKVSLYVSFSLKIAGLIKYAKVKESTSFIQI